jgi:hypothetical protein
MFNWDYFKKYEIKQAAKDTVPTEDGIHCNECGQHLSEHGQNKDGILLHPDYLVEIGREYSSEVQK